MIRLYGGSKLYSSGYCRGDVYDLFFIPSVPSESAKRLTDLSPSTVEEEQSSVPTQTAVTVGTSFSSSPLLHRHHSISSISPSLDGGSDDESLASGVSSRDRGTGYHRLQLKEDSTIRLLAPKTGIEGKYFLLKTELSHSKSTFTTDPQQALLPKLPQKASLPSSASTSSLSPLRNAIRKDHLSPLNLHSPHLSPNASSQRKRSPKKNSKPQQKSSNLATNHLSPITRNVAPTI